MKKPYFSAVIGRGFGDEGKGMMVDYLASQSEHSLVIRHNGGVQSGHTVEIPGKRFVFHGLGSGTYRGAHTFWADTFFPDLYKFGEEVEAFQKEAGFRPCIYADVNTPVTIIDDVLLNMAAELSRKDKRHGSCGMGIYEAQCRTMAGYDIRLGEFRTLTQDSLTDRLGLIRRDYVPGRMKELGIWPDACDRWEELPKTLQREGRWSDSLGEYLEMLQNDTVLRNATEQMLANFKYVCPVENVAAFITGYENVIFENGQGLLLDSENSFYSPHVTASRTGLTNPCKILQRMGEKLDAVFYVTRSYVTRHGAGYLPGECTAAELGIREEDSTNTYNPWQEFLRYARHESVEKLLMPIKEDIKNLKESGMSGAEVNILVTHLNETDGCVVTEEGDVPEVLFTEAVLLNGSIHRVGVSETRYSREIRWTDSRGKDLTE